MNTYNDPEDIDSVVEQIMGAQTIGSIYEIANNVFPNWILTFVPHYCENYPHLEQNWHYICRKNESVPSQIVLVSYLSDDKDHKLMNMFLDVFYRAGFVIRSIDHYVTCQACDQFVVPTKFMYDKFKEHNIRNEIPSVWSSICKHCSEEM